MSPTCSIEKCDKPLYARTWCSGHYKKWLLYGSPDSIRQPGPAPKNISDRFWGKVAKGKDEDCWLWTAYVGRKNGYGTLWSNEFGKNIGAHIVSWYIFSGNWPEKGMSVCHTCDVGHCVNPKHLWLGTPKDNSIDMVKKGRNSNQWAN